jgi:hypothetical protein
MKRVECNSLVTASLPPSFPLASSLGILFGDYWLLNVETIIENLAGHF